MQILNDPDFGNLPKALADLFASAGERSFFNLAGWYALVARHGMTPGWRPCVVVDDRVTAGFVFQSRGPASELTSCVNPYTCDHGPLLCDGTDSKAAGDLLGEIAQGIPSRFRITLLGLDPAAPEFGAMEAGLRLNYRTRPFFGWGTWYEDVQNESFDTYLAKRPSTLRNTWIRKSNALTKAQASFHVRTAGEPLQPYIDAYEQAHAKSWKESEPFPDFVPQLIRLADSLGALRMGKLDIGGEPAAAQVWIVWRQQALIFKLAHARRYEQFSPGTLLTMHMLQHIIERDRPHEINFGRGDDAYKKLWASQRRERWGVDAANPRSLRGFAIAAGMMAAKARHSLVGPNRKS